MGSGQKASHVLRTDDEEHVLIEGDQIAIGGNNRYVSVYRKHYKAREIGVFLN